MKTILIAALALLAPSGFAQQQSDAVSIIEPIPPEKITEYEMKVVIYNKATRSHNKDIGKLVGEGWYVHSILPFGWRFSGASASAYKEDLLIVYIKPRTTPYKQDPGPAKKRSPYK